MLAIVLLIAAFNLTSSAPVLPSTPDAGAAVPVTIFGREIPECVHVARYRTLQGIAWSCLATIFACTWVAVHPDIPPPEKSKWKKFWGRVRFMVLAILAPEYVIGVAVIDWLNAIKHAAEYNRKHYNVTPPSNYLRWYFCKDREPGHWTITHGFLLDMEGLVDDRGNPIRSVEEEIDEPLAISEEEINDKSKGDFLTKLFVVLQTSWFVFQCLARWITRLPVTELEVTTLAYAILNIGTYALWWNKPQGMGLALRMSRYKMPEKDPQVKEVAGSEGDVGKGDGVRKGDGAGDVVQGTPSGSGIITKLFFARLSDIGMDWEDFSGLVWMAMSGSVFGGFHLIPLWSSSFPSSVEKLLWKICAILVIILPLLASCLHVLGITVLADFPLIFILSIGISFTSYIGARIILVVIAFTTLRDLPPDAFRSVVWTTYIPHL